MTIKEQAEKIKEEVSVLSGLIDNALVLEKTLGVEVKFSIGQKVWVLDRRNRPDSWYKFSVLRKFEDAFEEVIIRRIHISTVRDSSFRGCATGSDKEQVEIIATYSSSSYSSDGFTPGWLIWASKKEAMKVNKKEFFVEKNKYAAQQKKDKSDRKESLKRQLKELK